MGDTNRPKAALSVLLIVVGVTALIVQYQHGEVTPEAINNSLEAVVEGLQGLEEATT